MLCWSIKLNENYAFEVAGFYKYRAYSDGVTFLNFDSDLSLYSGDHNPQFRINLTVLNFMIFDIAIYNMNHRDR